MPLEFLYRRGVRRPCVVLPLVAWVMACGDPLLGRVTSTSVTAGSLTIHSAFALPPFTDAPMPVYLTIENTGDQPDSLLGASTSVAAHTMLHGGGMEGLQALAIPGRGTLALRPGETHLMVEPPLPSFARGDSLQVTLRFARAGAVDVWAVVIDYNDLDRMRSR